MNSRTKIIFAIFALILVVLASVWIKNFLQTESSSKNNPVIEQPVQTPKNENSSPSIISTKPNPLEEAIISAYEIIEITFNTPLENEPEFRRRFDPQVEHKVELSADKKVVRFIPQKPYELGTTYTLFISGETKFEGGKRLDGEKIYHFSTIKYRGV